MSPMSLMLPMPPMPRTNQVSKTNKNNQSGFTLIELMLVIAILIIAIGVTGDIVLTLIRTYNKTQIGNEIEQNANFSLQKIEKELRNATSVTSVTPSQITFIDQDEVQIVYTVALNNGYYQLFRNKASAGDILITNNDPTNGVKLADCAVVACFSQVSAVGTVPYVIKLRFDFSEAGGLSGTANSANITVEDTLVVRGTY